jgi:hypothetical protein
MSSELLTSINRGKPGSSKKERNQRKSHFMYMSNMLNNKELQSPLAKCIPLCVFV